MTWRETHSKLAPDRTPMKVGSVGEAKAIAILLLGMRSPAMGFPAVARRRRTL